MTIRDARVSDAVAIAGLLTELGYPNDSEFVMEKLQLFTERGSSLILVGVIDNVVTGFICFDTQPLFHQDGLIGTIMALSVGEKFRGQGIGHALVARVEEIAKEAGCVKIAVASGVHRLDAHRFYLGIGYEEITKRFVKQLSQ